MRYIDAHNHLQDERFAGRHDELLGECQAQGVVASAVNGACPEDWPLVAELAARSPVVVPNFGVHPWYINDVPKDWRATLIRFLDSVPSGVGEVGIDGWRRDFDPTVQEEIFIEQLHIAAERNLPISIHGLRRWGRLLEILSKHPRPTCGFLLHSYSGPVEMLPSFTKLGAYFSCPGFFLNPGREIKLKVFESVPEDRLLLETDAPDQLLPPEADRYQLKRLDNQGTRLNHPANIVAVYNRIAELRKLSIQKLADQIELNFRTLFGGVLARQDSRMVPRT